MSDSMTEESIYFDSFKHAIQAQAPDRVLPHNTFELHYVPVVPADPRGR